VSDGQNLTNNEHGVTTTPTSVEMHRHECVNDSVRFSVACSLWLLPTAMHAIITHDYAILIWGRELSMP
jgi:hypothetical protein